MWFIDFFFYLRAVAGRDRRPVHGHDTILYKLNPHWSAAVKAIAQQLAQRQIQEIHHIGQLGQIYTQTGAEMRQQNLNDWYSRQEVVERPSGYGHAWVSENGEYILAEDPAFNPNVETNQIWTEMPQQ